METWKVRCSRFHPLLSLPHTHARTYARALQPYLCFVFLLPHACRNACFSFFESSFMVVLYFRLLHISVQTSRTLLSDPIFKLSTHRQHFCCLL